MSESSIAEVMLVEDDDVEIQLIERLARRQQWPFRLSRARDGQEALELLQQREAEVPSVPLIVLLDLNMPRMDGFEFLSHLRRDERLRHTVTMIFSTSSDPHDVSRAYEHAVAAYFVKGQDDRALGRLLESYARLNAFPPSTPPA